jgi:hypothetical protein
VNGETFYKAIYSPDVEGKTTRSVKAVTAAQAVDLAKERDSWGKCYGLYSCVMNADSKTGEIKTVETKMHVPTPYKV